MAAGLDRLGRRRYHAEQGDLRAAIGSPDSWPFPISALIGRFVLVASAGADG
jgi:hypothetical protein